MGNKRGRPPTITVQELKQVLTKHKGAIVKDNKLSPKDDIIWETISKELNNVITSKSIHSLVACNRHNIRDELMPNFCNDTSVNSDGLDSTWNSVQNVSADHNLSVDVPSQNENSSFTFTVDREEFQDLIIEQTNHRYRNRGNKRTRVAYHRNVLKPGEWQLFITNKIWETTRQKCGFNFEQHYVSADKLHGSISGHCHCKSKLKIKFKTSLDDVIFNCNATVGDGTCKKIYLRKPKRIEVAKTLQEQTTHKYRSSQANQLMKPGDPEPPHLPRSQVLRTAKSEYQSTLYYDRDPITAISIMHVIYPETIHFLSEIEVGVHIWTNHQRDVYMKYASRDKNTCLYIDATGGIFPKFIKRNKTKSHSLFLYIIAARFAGEQFTVGQMISDAHTTVAILRFWENWLAYGFPAPSEVVMDSSMALLNATVTAFTSHKSVFQYANACMKSTLPDCYIRLDVAHFIRLYAEVLKPSPQLVRVFFLACIGKLICMTDESQARSWIKAIFILASSERTGLLPSGEESPSSKAKNKLQNEITGTSHVDEAEELDQKMQETDNADLSDSESSDDDDKSVEPKNSKNKNKYKDDLLVVDTSEDTTWALWGEKILEEAKNELNDNGDSINPLYHLKLVNKLLRDIRLIVLWSCIMRPKFKRGRIPASSASVEGEIKLVKSGAFRNKKRRIDQGTEDLIKYIQGRTKLVDAGIQDEINQADQNLPDQNNNSKDDEHTSIDEANNSICDFDDTEFIDQEDVNDNENNPTPTFTDSNSTANKNNSTNISHDQRTTEILDETVDKTINETANKENNKNVCEACVRGDMPTGIHRCLRCNKPVHILDSCSSRVDGQEEGYGEWRLCNICKLIDNKSTEEFVAKKHVENWRGEGNPQPTSKSRSKYINGESHIIKDKLLYDKSAGIPILKNGSSRKVKAVNIGNRTFSFSNTCPFDSILQILLAGASDYPVMQQKMTENDDNQVFSLVLRILKDKKITATTYRLRGQILLQYFEPKNPNDKIINAGVELINCLSNAAGFAAQLFKRTPSLKEITECKKKCVTQERSISVINLNAESLRTDFDRVFEDFVFFEKPCLAPDCKEKAGIVDWSLGAVTIFEPYWEGLDSKPVIIELRQIPKEINTNEKHLRLLGIVEFIPHTVASRRSNDKKGKKENDSLPGHYHAISYRRDGQWIIYDDCRDKPIRVKDSTKANINAIFYTQI